MISSPRVSCRRISLTRCGATCCRSRSSAPHLALYFGSAWVSAVRRFGIFGTFINFCVRDRRGRLDSLFVVWWGYGLKVVIILLLYIIVFPMLYNTMLGVRTVPQVYINAVRSLGATRRQVLTQVVFPAALPHIFTGFRVGAGFAFRGLIFARDARHQDRYRLPDL